MTCRQRETWWGKGWEVEAWRGMMGPEGVAVPRHRTTIPLTRGAWVR